MDSDNILIKILEWAWLALVAVVVHFYRKVFGIESRTILIEEQQKHFETQRVEDRELRKDQRKEIIDRIESHHKTVMGRLDELSKTQS